jgi:hypothetical protein
MRTPVRLVLALSVASTLALSVAGCSGTSSVPTTALVTQQSQIHAATIDTQTQGKKKKHGHGHPEIINQFNTVPNPSIQPTNFEIVLKGNLVTAICGASNPPCADEPLYGPYNPFCPPSQGPNNPCYPIVTYNPTSNTTTVTYAGPVLYDNTGTPGDYHFGLFATPGETGWLGTVEASSYWSYPSSPNSSQPFVSINQKTGADSIDDSLAAAPQAYAEVFISVSLKPGGPVAYGTWNDIAYTPLSTRQPHLTFTNYGTQVLYVTSSGIILNQPIPTDPQCLQNPACPEDMQILSTLNFTGSPPPGDPGSQFIPLQFPPAKILKPTKP